MTAVDWRLSAQEWAPKAHEALARLEQEHADGMSHNEVLEAIAQAIRSRRLSIGELAANMGFRRNTLRRRFTEAGIHIGPIRPGPLSVCDPDDLRRKLHAFTDTTHLTPGYKRLAMVIAPE
jgi:hypothetical protein